MVKGVNKSVIEISDTDNEFFNKIILFVSPSCGDLDSKILHNEAQILISKICSDDSKTSLRAIVKKDKRKKIIISAAVSTVVALIVVVGFIL